MAPLTTVGIIPARYDSTRFPGKPLAMLGGKTMIRRVYEQASLALTEVAVATDNELIYNEVLSFGGTVVMTSPEHRSGTDRCFEAVTKLHKKYDIVVNIQGDEPFIRPEQILLLASCFTDSSVSIATLARVIQPTDYPHLLENPNVVKVVFSKGMNAQYFSRSVIPFVRNTQKQDFLPCGVYHAHMGLYAFRTDVLKEIVSLSPSEHEELESLEQLRWLDNDYRIKVALTHFESFGIDTPEDLIHAEQKLKTEQVYGFNKIS